MAELQPRRAQESIHHAGARLGGVVIVWVTIASSIGRRITQSMRGAVRMVQSSMHAALVSLVVAGVRARVTADTRNCPETATKLPGGGHETCPLAVMRSARHDSVCLAASRG